MFSRPNSTTRVKRSNIKRGTLPKLETFRRISARRELTFESLGTSLINLFGKRIFGERSKREKSKKNAKIALDKHSTEK